MNDTVDGPGFGTGVFLMLCLAPFVMKGCYDSGAKSIQVEAVQQGHAHWVPDDGGKSKFTWKAKGDE